MGPAGAVSPGEVVRAEAKVGVAAAAEATAEAAAGAGAEAAEAAGAEAAEGAEAKAMTSRRRRKSLGEGDFGATLAEPLDDTKAGLRKSTGDIRETGRQTPSSVIADLGVTGNCGKGDIRWLMPDPQRRRPDLEKEFVNKVADAEAEEAVLLRWAALHLVGCNLNPKP